MERVRLRIGGGKSVEVPAFLPRGGETVAVGATEPEPEPGGRPGTPVRAAAPRAFWPPGPVKPVIALVEAVPAGAADLALAMAEALEEAGGHPGLVCLDGQHRLGRRLGQPGPVPAWCWKQAAPDLILRQGGRYLVPGCTAEGELTGEAVRAVIDLALGLSEAVLVDLGCRWEARLFRPVLAAATHIWILTRSGQWSGAEMRLEQAEFSGWTPMDRVKVVAVGASAPPSGLLTGVPVAQVSEPGGRAAREFVLREVGRVLR